MPLDELAYLALPMSNENGAAAGTYACLQVRNAVADHVALVKSYKQVLSCLLQHSNLWLTTLAGPSELGSSCFWMMEAVIDLIDPAARLLYGVQHFTFKKLEGFDAEVPFGDARLIRNNGGLQAHVVQQPNCFWNARNQFELGALARCIDDASILVVDEGVDYTITVQ